jgi:hypothetical protein
VAWTWFLRLAQRGKDAARFVGTLARYAARAVRCGRRLRGSESLRDILSRQAQKRHGFTVGSLPISTRVAMDDIYAVPGGQRELDEYEERLADNAMTPPPDAAAFRIDFPVFLNDLSDRDRKMAAMLSLGHTVKHVAREFGITPARVTQLRVDWCRDWYRRHGERAPIDSRHKESNHPCVA